MPLELGDGLGAGIDVELLVDAPDVGIDGMRVLRRKLCSVATGAFCFMARVMFKCWPIHEMLQ